MNKIAIVSAIFGEYDNFNEPCDIEGADFYLFTDNHKIKSNSCNVITTPHHLDDDNDIGLHNSLSNHKQGKVYNMMAAKYYKINHHKIPCLQGYKYTVWVDGSFKVTNKDFARQCIDLISGNFMCLYAHPYRNTVKEEVAASLDFNIDYLKTRYYGQPILEQYKSYVENGFSDESGLYACGFIIRQMQLLTSTFMDIWWKQIQEFSYQDQLSFSYIIERLQLRIGIIPGNIFKNELINFVGHK